MEPEGLLPRSEDPDIGSYPQFIILLHTYMFSYLLKYRPTYAYVSQVDSSLWIYRRNCCLCFSHALCMLSRPTRPSCPDDPNNIRRRVKSIKLIITQFSSSSSYLLLFVKLIVILYNFETYLSDGLHVA
jgi:hypothetical protein